MELICKEARRKQNSVSHVCSMLLPEGVRTHLQPHMDYPGFVQVHGPHICLFPLWGLEIGGWEMSRAWGLFLLASSAEPMST